MGELLGSREELPGLSLNLYLKTLPGSSAYIQGSCCAKMSQCHWGRMPRCCPGSGHCAILSHRPWIQALSLLKEV